MAFNWKSFATGFMEKAVDEFETEKAERKELFKLDYMDKLQRSREERDRRRNERKELDRAGKRLVSLGLSSGAAGQILEQEGAEGANALYELTSKAMASGAKINVETFVSGAYDANLSITDAIDRVMGELKPKEGAKPAAVGEESFFGKLFGMDRVDEQTAQFYQKTFGEDYGTIAAEAEGAYERTPMTGTAKIDYSQLYLEDPDAELNTQIKQAQLKKLQAESKKDDKFKSLTPSQLNTARKDLGVVAGAKHNVTLKWTEEEGYILPPNATNKHLLALADATSAMVQLDALNDKIGYAQAYKVVESSLMETEEAPPPPPPEDEDADADAVVVTEPPPEVSTYIEQKAQEFAGMDEADKKGYAVNILGVLRKQYNIGSREEAIALLPPELQKYLTTK